MNPACPISSKSLAPALVTLHSPSPSPSTAPRPHHGPPTSLCPTVPSLPALPSIPHTHTHEFVPCCDTTPPPHIPYPASRRGLHPTPALLRSPPPRPPRHKCGTLSAASMVRLGCEPRSNPHTRSVHCCSVLPSRAHPRAVVRVAGVARLTRIARPWLSRPWLSRPPALRPASQDGRTPLHIASQMGRTAMVEQLIAVQADVESKTEVLYSFGSGKAYAVPPSLGRLMVAPAEVPTWTLCLCRLLSSPVFHLPVSVFYLFLPSLALSHV